MMVKVHIDTLISIEFQHHPLPILKKYVCQSEKSYSGEQIVLASGEQDSYDETIILAQKSFWC